jgi:hypothetical protein
MSVPASFSKRNIVLALGVSAYMVLLTIVSIQ